jgi:streptogramin lyase
MKRFFKQTVILMLVLCFTMLQALSVGASQTTSYTKTLDDDNNLVRTQDAYLPDRTITNLGLSTPSDIYVDDNSLMYIADTDNSRVVIYDLNTETVVQVIGRDICEGISTPKGVFVDQEGNIFIADTGAATVFKVSPDYTMLAKFDKPDTPIYSDAKYDPAKVAVDAGGSIYIVCESNNTGIVQLAGTGEFLGYFTSNKTVLSPKQVFLKLIYTKEQELKSAALNANPTTFSNIFVDDEGTVYTTSMNGTQSLRMDLIKKHSTDGSNMYTKEGRPGVVSTAHTTDIFVDSQGIIYSSDVDGFITIYTSSGDLIFQFGAQNKYGTDISGLFTKLNSVTVDNQGVIWTVDSEKGYLQSFIPTDYATTIYTAQNLYEHGQYEQSLIEWNKVLRLNQMSVLAHKGVGKAYYQDGEYEKAMEHFEIAGDRDQYSNAYWEVRRDQIGDNISKAFIFLLVIIVLRIAWAIGDRKKALSKKKRDLGQKLKNVPVLGELWYSFRTARHPIDRYYDIRVGKNGSLVAATIIYIIFFITYMIYQTSKGFVYQKTDIEDMDISAIVVGFFAILILAIICNWLVTSINDGDGTLKQIYMIPAYGLVPAWISMIAVIAFSYVLTANEAFLLTVMLVVGVGWTIANIFNGLSTVHDYSFGQTVVSIIITFLFMIIAAVVVVIVIIMWDQLSDFLITAVKEVIRNVTA